MPATEAELCEQVTRLAQRLIACDTSNPPGNETQAAAIIEEYLGDIDLECERVAKEEGRANLLVRLRGKGSGPSLGFLGHLDVVVAPPRDWSVDPFVAAERDGAIWGRGAVDMKCQVAATTVALRQLALEGFVPNGDLMLLFMADEEVGDARVGSFHFVEERPELNPDFVVGEGSGERFETPAGPVYLLDCGIKATAAATLTVQGRAGDASLPDAGTNAVYELARLLLCLQDHRSPVRVPDEIMPVLDVLAPGDEPVAERVAAARAAHPALDSILGALVGTVIHPTIVESTPPQNAIPEEAVATLACIVLPGTTREELEAELRDALGKGSYQLEVEEPTRRICV